MKIPNTLDCIEKEIKNLEAKNIYTQEPKFSLICSIGHYESQMKDKKTDGMVEIDSPYKADGATLHSKGECRHENAN